MEPKPFRAPKLVIVPRDDWGAVEPLKTAPMEHPIPMVMFHMNTDMDPCNSQGECVAAVKELQKRHMAEGADDIKFNFLVGGDLRVYEGRGFRAQCCPTLKLPHFIPTLPEPTAARVLQFGFIGRFENYDSLPEGYAIAAYDCANDGVKNELVVDGYSYYEHPNSLDIDIIPEHERPPLKK